MVSTETDLRPSGIPVLGNVPWSTHFCQFYQTKRHLTDVLVPYFQKGLESNEFCVWVTSKTVTTDEAREALSAVVPDLAEREAKGQFEVFAYTDWYLAGGQFDMKRILDGWAEKYRLGLDRGYAGLRVSGDTAWLESENWADFSAYEQSIDGAIEGSRILVLCTYSLDRCGPYELLDVVRNHQFALVLGQRGWERIENAELARLRELQQESQETIRRQNEWLRVTLTSIGDAVIATDTAGRVTFLNPVASALTGWTSEEALGQPIGRVLPTIDENTRQPAVDVVAQVLSEKRTVAMANHTALLTRDGREVPIEDSAAPILDAAGNVAGVVLVFHDVTEKRRAQAELLRAKQMAEDASRAKDQFIAALSHELRTPLTPTLAAAGAMCKDPRLPEDVRADAAMIQRNIGLEVALINDLLDVTRIANGKLSLTKAPVDVAHIVREAAGICCGDLDAKGQILSIDLPGAPYPVEADIARLHQVFWNLIKNAIKFTPDHGRIQIRAERRGGSIRITVSDNGIGIDAAVLPRLFSAFEQGDQSPAFGGLGLGLAIARGVVEAHGGRISAASDGPNQGATFTVELPLLPMDRASRLASPEPAHRATDGEQLALSKALRILLVEDHADTARMMARLLMAEGHEVVTADCVRTAFAAAGDGPFDVLMCDLGLPDGTGHDLMRQLLAAGKQIKGIAISGYGSPSDLQESRNAGFAEHITKPVAFDALQQALMRIAK